MNGNENEPESLKEKQETLIKFLEGMINKLDKLRSGDERFTSEQVYAEVDRVVGNCELMELTFDILVGSKLAKYIHVAYVLLLNINDQSNPKYQPLLARLGKLRDFCQRQILKIVNSFSSSF